MPNRTTQVVLNTITNYIRLGISLAVMFFMTPFIISKVGVEDFGLWSLVFSVIGFFGLLDLGFATGIVKYVAEYKGKGDIEGRNRILSTIGVAYLIMALVALAGIGFFSLFFNQWFSIPRLQEEKALVLLWILAFRAVILALPLGIFKGILFGEQKIYMINFTQTAATLLYALGAWFLLERGGGIIEFAWVNLAAMILEHIVYIFLAFKYTDSLRISPALAGRKTFKQTLSFSGSSFIVNISNLVLLRTDPVIAKLFLPLSAVAIYAVALKIAENAYLLSKQFINVLSPLIAELKAGGDERSIHFIIVNCTKFALVPGVMLTALIYVFAYEAITFWVGEEFYEAGTILIILMTAMLLSIPELIGSNVLTMTGSHKYTATASLISMSINVVLSFILIYFFQLIGVAMATLISAFIVNIFIIVRRVCVKYKISYFHYLRKGVLPAILPGILMFGLTYMIKIYFPPTGLLSIILESLPGTILYMALFWLFAIEASEKQMLRRRK